MFLGMLAWSSPGHAQDCTPPAVVEYSGPLFDAMAQTDQHLDAEGAVATAKSVGVTRMALFARVYRRQDGRRLVNDLAAAHPDFIVVGSPKRFDMRGDLSSSYVDDVLDGARAGRFRFVGEILYAHGDKANGEITPGGERYIDPTEPETARLVEGLKGLRVPIFTHWEAYDWSRDWPKFDRLYTAYPDQLFVWPHLGLATPQEAMTVLSEHPNVWATMSKKDNGSIAFADAEKTAEVGDGVVDRCNNLKPKWRNILTRFYDRLMFATDAHVARRWGNYAFIVRRWRVILGQLPPNVASAIAYDNAARLLGSRANGAAEDGVTSP